MFDYYRARLIEALQKAFPQLEDKHVERVELTPTKNPLHGDMATNAAMVLAGVLKKSPREIATAITQQMTLLEEIEEASIAGPGFVNLRFADIAWQKIIPQILKHGFDYGRSDFGGKKRVNVEYISANPTGPLHVGHCRGAVVGDVLASILDKTGFDVTREFYVNDAGVQVKALAWATYWRYLQAFEPEFPASIIEEKSPVGLQYGGDYLIEVGQALADKYGKKYVGEGSYAQQVVDPVHWQVLFQEFAVDYMLKLIQEDLHLLGVYQDDFVHESRILKDGLTRQALEILEKKNCLYEGVLPPPKGKQAEDWESREQLLFRSTDFGDDRDRPLKKSDGSNTYFANDIGYHFDKIKRGFELMIDVWGADHGGYVKRLSAAVAALSDKKVPLEVILCQIVHILRDGEIVRMSKRAGQFVTVRALLDEVGRDAIRFTMLTRRSDAQMNFDLAEVVAQKRENPIFYVQYAHARCCSVLKAAQEEGIYGDVTPQALCDVSLESLQDPAELTLIRKLAQWPRTLKGAAMTFEPHRIAFYLLELAADFHSLWNHGKENTKLRFLQSDHIMITRARLALIWANVIILRAGFEIVGVTPVEEMR